MSSRPYPPLRVQKGSAGSSPSKLPVVTNRPLSELSPMAIRRNSPSFPQSKVNLYKEPPSPAGSSPFNTSSIASPRLFWQERDPGSPARENLGSFTNSEPTKRSSIENLKKASRVKNSSMYALEQTNYYDPSKPSILDGRPSGLPYQSSRDLRSPDGRKENVAPPASEQRSSSGKAQGIDGTVCDALVAPLSPSRFNGSPGKSSLSRKSGNNFRQNGFDPDNGIWEDEDDDGKKLPPGKGLHRHAKSVTFDQAPPQINEYEMTTPDPSSVASGSREGSYDSTEDDEDLSFERANSMDHDDSFDASLEDIDKTPVVMPEDWKFMDPDSANTDLVDENDDAFEDGPGSPAPQAHPGALAYRPHQTSVNSVDSNGSSRPLPPLPSMTSPSLADSPKRESLSGTLERMSGGQRNLPNPPPAATISKSDIHRMSGSHLSMDDRLRIMMEQEKERKTEQDLQRERRMRRAEPRDISPAREPDNKHHMQSDSKNEDSIPHLSRTSILEQTHSSEDKDSDRIERTRYDPDIPIPSLEDPTVQREHEIAIKEEEDETDLYAIPDLYCRQGDTDSDLGEDVEHQFKETELASALGISTTSSQGTARGPSPVQPLEKKSSVRTRVALPDFVDFGDESSFNLGLESYMTPPRELGLFNKTLSTSDSLGLPDLAALRTNIQKPFTTHDRVETHVSLEVEHSIDDRGTPDSVIRHSVEDSSSPELEEVTREGSGNSFSANVQSRDAMTNGYKEKDLESPVSDHFPVEKDDTPRIQGNNQLALESVKTEDLAESTTKKARVSSLVQLELPQHQSEEGLGFGLEKEFDRVVEAQKVAFELSFDPPSIPIVESFQCSLANTESNQQRGYLMRQNTKVVVASERISHEEPRHNAIPEQHIEANHVQPSPRKTSQPTWTAEPWNGRIRRKSIRVGGEKSVPKRKMDGPIPPLPGQASNVQEGLGAVAEDDSAEEETEEFEDGMERGRLFVKVIGAKDLQLPFPKHERTYFALTLDNGLHCVTTAWLDLARDAPIGQEFELTVLNELEFQLTLQMKLEEPVVQRPQSPTKAPGSPKKQGAFGRLFGSPKKKKEEAKSLDALGGRRPVTPPSAYELVQGLVAKDGSFARAYVSLSEHEKQSYGRPYVVEVMCYNEWATEEVNSTSSRSRKGSVQIQRRPPYAIGKLELQLLYVPKPKGAKDDEMPRSMNSAIRAMREAEERLQHVANMKDFEGHLSQQGGDCPYWRRRFFKLVGPKLTAYHEATLQPRATINLAKATKLIDDKSALTQKETSTRGGGRRKSAFAEEEEGYMFVEEGFRIRFANGEVIDFYADSTAQKDEWMKALSQVVGKGVSSSAASAKGWTEIVLKREKQLRAKEKQAKAEQARHHSPARPNTSYTGAVLAYQQVAATAEAKSPSKARPNPAERHRKTKSTAV